MTVEVFGKCGLAESEAFCFRHLVEVSSVKRVCRSLDEEGAIRCAELIGVGDDQSIAILAENQR